MIIRKKQKGLKMMIKMMKMKIGGLKTKMMMKIMKMKIWWIKDDYDKKEEEEEDQWIEDNDAVVEDYAD
ncbi:MAG: hypothetical protein EZS28_018006 [Streblomastix strix]|uniref:Uncharacterized protein n=1 Tax=Streblomastix strix TaxID=222440 RepID=A0A5J4VV83_9EUKA|nr:MAG: hypothetical protein EZS28_018006 [Streblomastix strix]